MNQYPSPKVSTVGNRGVPNIFTLGHTHGESSIYLWSCCLISVVAHYSNICPIWAPAVFVYTPSFFPYFLLSLHFIPDLFTSLLPVLLSTSSRIGLFHFQAGGRRWPNLALVMLCYGCMFAFVVFDLVFSTKARDWLGIMSPKWPISCGS